MNKPKGLFIFFCASCLLTTRGKCAIIWRRDLGRPAPNFLFVKPYSIFLLEKVTLGLALRFPQSPASTLYALI